MKLIRVLNVNDREIPRYLAEEMLQREKFEVTSASSGYEALALARAQDFDIALLDVQLPDLDGFSICERLRSDSKTANMIVLMTSATFVTPKNKIAGLESGADGYLVQPYETAELVATLRSLLRSRAAERRASALAEELQTSMNVRDEFLAMLGHELRNPIGTITTALSLLESNPETPKRDHYMEILGRQARNLSRIVDDLLDVARITRGKVVLERKTIDLCEVARHCVDSLADDIRASKHTIELQVPDGPVLVDGDAVRLEQVVQNLVTNANKYTPAGGAITLRVTKAEGARIEVIDTGVGMTPQMAERVFDVFVQGAQTIDRSRGGLGLGLTVVRQLVELHEGKVSATSEGPGKGSRFVVELPLAPGQVATPGTGPEPAITDQPAGLNVVVIEDSDDARETLEEGLGLYHHEVTTAPDGIAGLALVLAQQPDVALVDIGLPGMDGYEIARQVRKHFSLGSPRLIAMTGYGQPEDRERAIAAGFDLHIVKPIVLKKLQKVLAEIPRRR